MSSFIQLSEGDRAALDWLARQTSRYRGGRDLIQEGDRPEKVFLLVEGWAYRYKVLEDGSRQIMAYLVPGDLCDPHIFILDQMDHSIGLLSDARVAGISKAEILAITNERPAVGQALWWSTLVDEAVLRHWLVNIGQRSAFDRIAHLFCELWERLNQVDLVRGHSLELPLTQAQLGETMGLTSVHVNRTLQNMRADGLIKLENKCLTIHDIDALRQISGFNRTYLHLTRRS